MNKMLIYFVLPLGVSFSRNQQLKTSDFVKNVTFPDGRNRAQTDFFFLILTHVHMTHVNFLVHRPLVISYSFNLQLKTSGFIYFKS